MPVTVQMPGFQNREAPISALANLANVVSNVYHNSKQNDLATAQAEKDAAETGLTKSKQAQEDIQTVALQKQQDIAAKSRAAKSQPTSNDVNNRATIQNSALIDSFVNAGALTAEQASPLKQALQGMTAQEQEDQLGPFMKDMTGITSARTKGVEGAIYRTDNAKPGAGGTNDARVERIHNQNLDKINRDPTVTNLINTANGLSNAISNFKNGGANPEEFNVLQQSVRSNTGISGNGGVTERQESYLKSLGINRDKLVQFLTGDPQSVLVSDPKFAAQILGIANLELQNKSRQANEALDQLSTGHRSFYAKHPDLADDYNETLKLAHSRIQAPQGSASPGGGAGKIRVSNGKENLMIDPADLQHAQADGFKQVK